MSQSANLPGDHRQREPHEGRCGEHKVGRMGRQQLPNKQSECHQAHASGRGAGGWDSGKEFAEHERLAAEVGSRVFRGV